MFKKAYSKNSFINELKDSQNGRRSQRGSQLSNLYRSASIDGCCRRPSKPEYFTSIKDNWYNRPDTSAESHLSLSNNAYCQPLPPSSISHRSVSNNACCKASSPARSFGLPTNTGVGQTRKQPSVSQCFQTGEVPPFGQATPRELMTYCTVSPCGMITPRCLVDGSCTPCYPCCGRPSCKDPCCNFEEEYRAIVGGKCSQTKQCQARRCCKETGCLFEEEYCRVMEGKCSQTKQPLVKHCSKEICCRSFKEANLSCETERRGCETPKTPKTLRFKSSPAEGNQWRQQCISCDNQEKGLRPIMRCRYEIDEPCSCCKFHKQTPKYKKSNVKNKSSKNLRKYLNKGKSNCTFQTCCKPTSCTKDGYKNPSSCKQKARIKSCCITLSSSKQKLSNECCCSSTPSPRQNMNFQKCCFSLLSNKINKLSANTCNSPCPIKGKSHIIENYSSCTPTWKSKPSALKWCLKNNTFDLTKFYLFPMEKVRNSCFY